MNEQLPITRLTNLLDATEKRSDRGQSGGLAPWQVRIAKEYLEEHSSGHVNLAGLAGLLRLSASRFAHGFKVSTGAAPYTWVLHRRVEKAKGLLHKNDLTIALIAMKVGFADQSHFTKAFKLFTGTTPHEWQVAQR
jgi:AraC family transcriptional regulator